ncbi:MAG: anthranilate synthase component I family protein [Flavipsychrobacter sp.]|nr:anthranilate synthase component I family protein [Flavipsychrobacter sp.]
MTIAFTANYANYLFDTETPISIYLKIREHFNQCVLLENAQGGLTSSQHSYICFDPIAGISVKGIDMTLSYPGGKKTIKKITDNRTVLSDIIDHLQGYIIDGLQSGFPGLVGYMTYDAVRYFEDIELPSNKDLSIPDLQYDLYRYMIVINHTNNELKLITISGVDEIPVTTIDIMSIISNKHIPAYPFKATSDERSDTSNDIYLDNVIKGKTFCHKGDVFQVVLSRSFEMDFLGDDLNVYRALRSVNPSPYMFYCDYNSFHLFGSSPEAQFKITNGTASIHPIAGTYKRTNDPLTDERLALQLQEDTKENSEHIMLVDLARNDLSKHYLQVNLAEYRKIEQYSHVMHMVSRVEGQHLLGDVHPLQILADTFPAGTLSGAPKYRAMNIIKATESTPRGYYGGCVGFIGLDGSINKAIMIRSFLSMNNTLHYRAGAGITAASVPENELQEINNKINALRKALNLANTL